MSNLYNKYVLPKIIHWACGQSPAAKQRERIIPLAKGNVLEIGIGSGLNLPYYDTANIKSLIGIEPFPEVWKENEINLDDLRFDFQFIQAFAENMPVDNDSIDQVVITYALCSIPDVTKALEEVRRVLKPNGQILFCEHGKAPDKTIAKWQDRLNPAWGLLGGGCQLNLDIPMLLKDNGFNMHHLESMYIPGWKPASFNYWGVANNR